MSNKRQINKSLERFAYRSSIDVSYSRLYLTEPKSPERIQEKIDKDLEQA
jgi:hypothetical protein